MSNPEYHHTIDWDQYWRDADDERRDDANGSVQVVVDPLLQFLESVEDPDSLADVGCGGGALVAELSNQFPDATVVGYDAAESVVQANRERTSGDDAVSFEHAVLPAFDPDHEFDVVTCFFTLCYVEDAERAVQALYNAVAPGGHLVLTYHNRFAQSLFETFAEDPHEHLPADGAWDPDTFADRFELVIEGASVLSYDRINDAVGTWPRSVWADVDAERYRAWRQNPLVYVPK